MHRFMTALSTETNTFSPMPTGLTGFEAFDIRHGTATADPPNPMTDALHLWRARGEALGWRVTESLTAIAEPAGLTTASAHAALKGEIMAISRPPERPISCFSSFMARWWPRAKTISKATSSPRSARAAPMR